MISVSGNKHRWKNWIEREKLTFFPHMMITCLLPVQTYQLSFQYNLSNVPQIEKFRNIICVLIVEGSLFRCLFN